MKTTWSEPATGICVWKFSCLDVTRLHHIRHQRSNFCAGHLKCSFQPLLRAYALCEPVHESVVRRHSLIEQLATAGTLTGNPAIEMSASENMIDSESRNIDQLFASTSGGPAGMDSAHYTSPSKMSCALLLGTSSYFMVTGTAIAMEDSPDLTLQEHLSSATHQHSVLLDAATIGDITLLPSIHSTPLGVLTFLLQNPLVTLGVAAALYYIVPRAFRALLRWIVLPLVLGLVAYVILENPSAALSLSKGLFGCKCTTPLGTRSYAMNMNSFMTTECLKRLQSHRDALPCTSLSCPAAPLLEAFDEVCVCACACSFECTPGRGERCNHHCISLCTEPLPPDWPSGTLPGCGSPQSAALPAPPPARPCYPGQSLTPVLSVIDP